MADASSWRSNPAAPDTIGPYTILGELGRGGMGTVYRARDTRLRRDVALKVLPEDLRLTPGRLARFEHEARVVAALSHPNIAAIYGIEDGQGGVRALVLELVEGRTLAARIAAGPLRGADALDIARQIASALDAAHEKGVIHRDLKPANIVITASGLVKVLDFGVAKMAEPTEFESDTMTVGLTREGAVIGTPAYMSPEQARGEGVDKRTDIWAFGCVLYEMLTARTPFDGETAGGILAAVQTKDPDWSRLPPRIPGVVTALLKRCLERDRARRLGDVAAIRFAFEDAVSATDLAESSNKNRSAARGVAKRLTWTLAALLAVAVAAAAAYLLRPTPAADVTAFHIFAPEGTNFVPATVGGAPALSPGRQIAFVAAKPGGPQQLWIRSFDAFDAVPIPGTDGAACPFWGFDGSWLGFLANGQMRKVNLSDRQQHVLRRDAAVGRVCFRGSQNESGTILSGASGLAVIPADGGKPEPATERNITLFEENHAAPSFLPGGRRFLFQVRGGTDLHFQLAVGHLESKERRELLNGLKGVTNGRFAPSTSNGVGHLVYVRNGTLFANGFDPTSMDVLGPERPLAENVAVAGGGALGDFDVSSDVLAYRQANSGTKELGWFDRNGIPAGTLGARPGNPRNNVRLSLDDRWVVFTRANGATQEVWIYDLETTPPTPTRITHDGRSPVLSPDASRVAYLRGNDVYVKPRTGGPEERLWTRDGILAISDWSGDGRYLLINRWDTSQPEREGRGLWLLPGPLDPTAKRDPEYVARGGKGQFGPRVGTPRWIAYEGEHGVTVRPMPGEAPADPLLISEGGGTAPRWKGDGRELYYLLPDRDGATPTSSRRMMVAKLDLDPSLRVRSRDPLFDVPFHFAVATGQHALGWDVTGDGQRFLTSTAESDAGARSIMIVVNWQRSLLPGAAGSKK